MSACESRFQARPFALGQPDEEFIPIDVSNHERRRAPVLDGRLNVLFTQIPPECLELIRINGNEYSTVAGPACGCLFLLIQDELKAKQTDLDNEGPLVLPVGPVNLEAQVCV